MGPPVPRHTFPVTQRWTYLNHAGVAPLATPVVEAIGDWARRAAVDGAGAHDLNVARQEEVRGAAARLMGVDAGDVAFVKNTTEGLSFVAGGLDWEPGDRVVVADREFPSALLPWTALRERGVIVDLVEPRGESWALPLDAWAEVIEAGPPPRVVSTSWVQFGRGWRTDLAALATLCHEAGALFVVDAIQGLGLLPADLHVWGVDAAAADGHKWLLGPEGLGVLYVRRSLLDRLRPLEPGWNAVAHREEWDNLDLVWDGSARRLEGGTQNMAGIHGLGAALDLLLEAGVEQVWSHVDGLCNDISRGLEEMGATVLSDRSAAGRSGIVTFRAGRTRNGEVHETLLAAGVYATVRGGGVRVSPHGYNDAGDVGLLLDAVRPLVS